jgi:aryl-alcohol dehydrogenase-like predicted oxidoreductase
MTSHAASINTLLDNSLKRLKPTILICINCISQSEKQFFWTKRFTVQEDAWEDNIHAVLDTLGDLIKEGKIKHIGLSNETPWGIMRFLEESKHHHLPRIKQFKTHILC